MSITELVLARGLSAGETWALIGIAMLAVAGAWFLLSQVLDALGDWFGLGAVRDEFDRQRDHWRHEEAQRQTASLEDARRRSADAGWKRNVW